MPARMAASTKTLPSGRGSDFKKRMVSTSTSCSERFRRCPFFCNPSSRTVRVLYAVGMLLSSCATSDAVFC
jgi:hypothetical protein